MYYSLASLTVCCWNQMPSRGSEYQNFNESCIRKVIKFRCVKVTPGILSSSLRDADVTSGTKRLTPLAFNN
jgi:hypothetical protein